MFFCREDHWKRNIIGQWYRFFRVNHIRFKLNWIYRDDDISVISTFESEKKSMDLDRGYRSYTIHSRSKIIIIIWIRSLNIDDISNLMIRFVYWKTFDRRMRYSNRKTKSAYRIYRYCKYVYLLRDKKFLRLLKMMWVDLDEFSQKDIEIIYTTM